VLTITQHICSMKNKSTKYTQINTNNSRLCTVKCIQCDKTQTHSAAPCPTIFTFPRLDLESGPPSNTLFLVPTQSNNQNNMSIESATFPQYMRNGRQTEQHRNQLAPTGHFCYMCNAA